jgi:predicted secreted protein
MLSESFISVVEGKELDILLKGEGVGGYRWFADHDTLEHFGKNYVGRKTFSNDIGLGGSYTYICYTFKFETCVPPLHKIDFIKKRPWSDEIMGRHSAIIEVFPTKDKNGNG